MKINSRLFVITVIMAVFCVAVAGILPARAKTLQFGGQISIAEDADFGIGARAVYDLGAYMPFLAGMASFDFFFPDEGDAWGADVDVTYWEINVNALYNFQIDAKVTPYAGGGLNIAHASVDVNTVYGTGSADDTEFGLNVLGGATFDLGMTVTPFAEFRFELSGGEQWVLTGGVLF